jgi:uncharacterized membrane protein
MNLDDPGLSRLERTIGRVLRAGVAVSSLLLIAGLGLTRFHRAEAVGSIVLTAGIGILIATPAARVAISLAEYVRERDWTFVALTSVVLLTLMISVVIAFRS